MSTDPVINPDEIKIETTDAEWPDIRINFTVPGHCVKLIVDRLEGEGQKIRGPKLYDLLAQICFGEAVSRLDLDPLWGASIIPMNKPMTLREGEDFCFSGCLDARLEIDWPDFSDLTIERPVMVIDDAVVDEELDEQRLDIGVSSPSSETLARGDEATGSIWIGCVDSGECFMNNDEVTIRVPAENKPALVEGVPFPELTSRLMGARPGDSLEASTIAPALEGMPDIAGTTLTCKFNIASARRIEPASIDDVVSYFECPNLQGLRLQIYHSLDLRFEREQMIQLTENVLGLLETMVDLPYPDRIVREVVARQQRQQYESLKNDGVDDSEIKSQLEASEQSMHDRNIQKIQRQVLTCMLQRHFKVNIGESDITEYIQLLASMRGETPAVVRKEIVDGGLIDQVSTKCVEREVVTRILEVATVVDVPVGDGPDHRTGM